MSVLVGREKIPNSILMNSPVRVLDPACGTGGFLVYLMKQSIDHVQALRRAGKITAGNFDTCVSVAKQNVFFGADANSSVASAAKMNMIIAGDGHSNIRLEDSLSNNAKSWSVKDALCDIIITNPPFGTSESDTLTAEDYDQFPVRTVKGQLLFIQKMVRSVKAQHGEVCTVIDEGVLNTDTAKGFRSWLIQNCRIATIVRLPEVTFKPNNINVRSSVLYMTRREHVDVDFESNYDVKFIDLKSLGYHGSGDPIRGFDENNLMRQIELYIHDAKADTQHAAENWRAFSVPISAIVSDKTRRLDLKYWDPEVASSLFGVVSRLFLRPQQMFFSSAERRFSVPA